MHQVMTDVSVHFLSRHVAQAETSSVLMDFRKLRRGSSNASSFMSMVTYSTSSSVTHRQQPGREPDKAMGTWSLELVICRFTEQWQAGRRLPQSLTHISGCRHDLRKVSWANAYSEP